MSKIAKVRYGIGYGSHDMEVDVTDAENDKEIEQWVYDAVMERVDFGYEVEED